MIDSHCHLNFKSLKDNFSNIIYNAKKNGLTGILSINTNPKDFEDHLKLIDDYKNIYISYGLHPDEINQYSNFDIKNIILNCKNKKVIGIGETGLDFYRSEEFKNKQFKIFENHIEASIKTNLPLIIHQRNSEQEIINILKSYQKNHDLSVVFHCFTGTDELLNLCNDFNYYISLSGIITFKNANKLREIVKNISLEHLLIETDSPFLAPVPMRGKQNEPSFIKYTANYFSDFFNIPIKSFIEITDNNFYKLFSKAKRYNQFE